MPLVLLSPGETGEITEIRVPATHCRCRCRDDGGVRECGDGDGCGDAPESVKHGVRLEDMGLRVGKIVEMLNNGGGPVLLRVDEARIAVARGMAIKILVRRIR